ncbi:MAG: Acyl-CoA thioesterase II, partial [uncultured Blastococcus sp.]
TSRGRAWTTRCGSTSRCAPTTGSSTRPTAPRRRPGARCASARSGPPTARTSPRSPRRASSARRGR